MRILALLLVAFVAVPTAATVDLRSLALQSVEAFAGFDFPVSFEFASDGRLFVTEKAGAIRVVDDGVSVWAQLDVTPEAEQGLLGLALHPDFAANGWVYVYYTDAGNDTNRVARITDVGGQGTNLTVVLDDIPNADFHNGGILAFGRDGTLFITTGDATVRSSAQDLRSLSGKVLRLNADGSVPANNPFPGSPVYSYGHRNVFGLAVDPETGILWVTENGPSRHDEVNRLTPGGNYGWPSVTGAAGRPEFVDPAFVFDVPLPALTQATFLTGDAYPVENRDALFVGAWNSGDVARLVLTPDRRGVGLAEVVHTFDGWGVLDVEVGPDGRLYVSARHHGSGAGTIFALQSLPPIGAGREIHLLALGALAVVAGTVFVVYLWKRRKLGGRQRS